MLDVHKDYRIRESYFLNDIHNKSEITLRDIIEKRNICRGTSRCTNESVITHRNSRNLFVTLLFIFHLIVIVIQTDGKSIVYIYYYIILYMYIDILKQCLNFYDYTKILQYLRRYTTKYITRRNILSVQIQKFYYSILSKAIILRYIGYIPLGRLKIH